MCVCGVCRCRLRSTGAPLPRAATAPTADPGSSSAQQHRLRHTYDHTHTRTGALAEGSVCKEVGRVHVYGWGMYDCKGLYGRLDRKAHDRRYGVGKCMVRCMSNGRRWMVEVCWGHTDKAHSIHRSDKGLH
eukprot:56813-Eustigmatos_ZCMA.PRE.1